ncbi:MAG TPA: GerMN domain-containing protein [Acidobacteriaceae bacterium]|nr:GerMN domain-containing protein [Acidobacteriaceae bacterium]
MIPRYQRILFWSLAAATLLMAGFLLHGCRQAREKLTRRRNETPLSAPVETPSQSVRLAVASDADGTISMADRNLALPSDPTTRARALLARLIAEYSWKNSTHPLESGPAIDDVFLLDLPLKPAAAFNAASTGPANDTSPAQPAPASASAGQLAVVNLNGGFVSHHPSGIEVETLTVDSIVGTLFANFPRVVQVRFLVDGQPHDTLAGHADLTRTYQAVDTATAGTAP